MADDTNQSTPKEDFKPTKQNEVPPDYGRVGTFEELLKLDPRRVTGPFRVFLPKR